MATTPINNKMKMAMSRAIPASLRRFRLVPRVLIATQSSLLIRIDTATTSRQLYKARAARGGVGHGSCHNQGNSNVANVGRRVVRAEQRRARDRKSTRLNSSHVKISYA